MITLYQIDQLSLDVVNAIQTREPDVYIWTVQEKSKIQIAIRDAVIHALQGNLNSPRRDVPRLQREEPKADAYGLNLVSILREFVKACDVVKRIGSMGHDSTDAEIADAAVGMARLWRQEEEHDLPLFQAIRFLELWERAK